MLHYTAHRSSVLMAEQQVEIFRDDVNYVVVLNVECHNLSQL